MGDPAGAAAFRHAPPWPSTTFVLDLDRLDPGVSPEDLLALERRTTPVIGIVRGRCDGPAMAAAACVHLLVTGPDATFRVDGRWADLALRRLVDIVGRRVAAYLVVSEVDAPRARTWGLVNRVADDPDGAAGELAAGVASKSPRAVEVVLEQLGRASPRDHALSRVTSRALWGETGK